jgi:hypothetical protein
MSKVKYIIEHLEQMPHDEQVCVTLWTREGVEELLDTELTDDQWDKCIDIWDNDNQSVRPKNKQRRQQWIVTYAKEQTEETAQ